MSDVMIVLMSFKHSYLLPSDANTIWWNILQRIKCLKISLVDFIREIEIVCCRNNFYKKNLNLYIFFFNLKLRCVWLDCKKIENVFRVQKKCWKNKKQKQNKMLMKEYSTHVQWPLNQLSRSDENLQIKVFAIHFPYGNKSKKQQSCFVKLLLRYNLIVICVAAGTTWHIVSVQPTHQQKKILSLNFCNSIHFAFVLLLIFCHVFHFILFVIHFLTKCKFWLKWQILLKLVMLFTLQWVLGSF